MLQVLYKLKTAKVFDRNRTKEDKGNMEVLDEDPFAIQIMAWCPESRVLCVAGVSANVIIYRFSKLEITTEVVQVGFGWYFFIYLFFIFYFQSITRHHLCVCYDLILPLPIPLNRRTQIWPVKGNMVAMPTDSSEQANLAPHYNLLL